MGRNPIPQGTYISAKRQDKLIFTAGMTPRKDGVLIKGGEAKWKCLKDGPYGNKF